MIVLTKGNREKKEAKSMTSKLCQITGLVSRPFAVAVNKIEATAMERTARNPAAVLEYIATHEAAGTDAAQASTRRYMGEQRDLMFYRVSRFFDECHAIGRGEYCRNYTVKSFVLDLRMLTKMLFLYAVFVMVGRQSVFPLLEPDSPFYLGYLTKRNPNM
jgi:hypothetical protein